MRQKPGLVEVGFVAYFTLEHALGGIGDVSLGEGD
jgi:hypothetical protein